MAKEGSNDPREAVQWKQHFVLLIDGSSRRDERATSLRQSGVVVHCASDGASAAELWEPEKYQLVLFEFFQAETDVRPFCEKLMRTSPRQRVGMYCPDPPFIVPPRHARFSSSTAATAEPAGFVSGPPPDALAAGAGPIVADTHASSSPAPARIAAQQPIRDRRQRALAAVARQKGGRNGLAQAAQEIAALRWRVPGSAAPVRQHMERPNPNSPAAPKPESHASLAARVLGGER